MLERFILLAGYSIALRWLIFEYRKFAFIRNYLLSLNNPFLSELTECVYCQTIEAAIVVYACYCLTIGSIPGFHILFGVLATGLLGLVLQATIDDAIESFEIDHGFNLTIHEDGLPPEDLN